jgi:hypothetical protein
VSELEEENATDRNSECILTVLLVQPGPNWAGTLLGLLEALCIPIPFIFYRYGGKIRQKSKLIREMRENKEKQERRKKRAEEKSKRRAAGEKGDVASVQENHHVADEEMAAETDENDVEKGNVSVETKS